MLSCVVALAVDLILLKHPVAASSEWDLVRRQAEISQSLKMLQRVRERSSGAPMAIPVPAALVGSGAGGWGMPGFDGSSDGGAGAFIDDNYVVDGTLFSEGGVEDDDPLPRRGSGGGRAISSLFHKVEVLRTLTSGDSTTFDSIQFLSSAAPPNDDSFAHYLMSFVDGGKAKRAKAARNEGKEKSLTDLRVLLTSRQHGRVLLGTPFYSSATGGANKLKLQLDPLVNATNATLANSLLPAAANAKKSDSDFYYGKISYVQPVNRRMFYVVRQTHSRSSSQTHSDSTHFLVEQYSCCLTPRLQHQTLLVVNGTGFVPSSKNMLLLPGGKEAYFADDFGRLKLLSSAGGAGAMVASMLQDPPTGAADRGGATVAPQDNKTASSKKKNDVKLDWNGNALAPNFRAASLMREKLAVKVADTPVVALQPVGADRFFFHTRNHFGWFSVKAADSAVPLCGGWGGGSGGNAAGAQVAAAGGKGGGTAGFFSIEEAVLAQNGLRVFLLVSSGTSSDGIKRSKILVYLAERSTLSSLKGAPQPKKSTSAEKICFLETAFPEVGGGLRNLHVIADRYVFALQGADSSAPGAGASAPVRLVFFGSEHEPGTLSAGRTFFVPDVLGELLGPSSSPSATSSTTNRIVRFAVSPFNGAAKKQLLFVVSTVVKTGNLSDSSDDEEKEKLEVFEFTVKSLVDAAHAAHQTHSAANFPSTGPALGAFQTQAQARTFRTTQRDQLRARKGAGSSEAADGDQNREKTSSATATATAGPWTWFGIPIPFTSYVRNYLFPGGAVPATTSASAWESANLMQTVDADDPTGERKGFWRKLWERIYLPKGLVMFGVVVVFCSYTVWKQRNKYNYTGGFRSGDDALAGQRAKRTEEQIMAGFRKVQKEVREHRGRRGGGSGVSSEDILREAGAGAGSGSSSCTSGGSDSEYEMVPRGEMEESDSDLTGREFYPTRKNFWLPPPGYNNDGGGERTLLDELLDEEGLVDADGDGAEDPDTELRDRTAVSQSASS